MGKLLTRLILIVLVGLVAYLYVQVLDLQRDNRQLTAQAGRLASLERENASLKLQLSRAPRQAVADEWHVDWMSEARNHILSAEQAVGKGNFGAAVQQTQEANAALTRAADNASAESRKTVQDLRSRLDQVQTKAKSIWTQFGG